MKQSLERNLAIATSLAVFMTGSIDSNLHNDPYGYKEVKANVEQMRDCVPYIGRAALQSQAEWFKWPLECQVSGLSMHKIRPHAFVIKPLSLGAYEREIQRSDHQSKQLQSKDVYDGMAFGAASWALVAAGVGLALRRRRSRD